MDRRSKTEVWYHPELDILRFFAFLLVFVFHITGASFFKGFSAGAYGVDLFFTLSAYLITEILLREQRRYGQFDMRSFYVRRILRIWPLYFAFLAFTFIAAQPLVHTESFPWSARLMFLLFVGNWQFVLGNAVHTVASPLWSVCVEEQFYLSWPLLLRRWMAKFSWVAVSLLVAASAWRIALVLHGPVERPLDLCWKSTLAHVDSIVLGAWLAFVLKGDAPRLKTRLRLLVGSCGFVAVILAGRFGLPYGPRSLVTYPVVAMGCVLMLIAVLRPMRSFKVGTISSVLVHLGRISYGLYVFHAACLIFCGQRITIAGHPYLRNALCWSVGFVLTVAIAECSYRFLELPFLRMKERFSRIRSAPTDDPHLSLVSKRGADAIASCN